MIPASAGFPYGRTEQADDPSFTYRLNADTVRGYADELEAMKQAIDKILRTERYENVIYSGNYGTELADLFGKPVTYVCPELERRITEALMYDERIESVEDFSFGRTGKNSLLVTFTVRTVFGEIKTEREVSF